MESGKGGSFNHQWDFMALVCLLLLAAAAADEALSSVQPLPTSGFVLALGGVLASCTWGIARKRTQHHTDRQEAFIFSAMLSLFAFIAVAVFGAVIADV